MTTEAKTTAYPEDASIVGGDEFYLKINNKIIPGVTRLDFHGAFASRHQAGTHGEICMYYFPNLLPFFDSLGTGRTCVELLRLDKDLDSSTFGNKDVYVKYDVVFSREYDISMNGNFPMLTVRFDILPGNETEEA